MRLTATFVEEVKPPLPAADGRTRQVFFRDSECVGFALRVTSNGTKSYILERRIRGKVKRITLGRCGHLEFTLARARAAKLIDEIERENSPRTTRRTITRSDLSLREAYHAYLAAHPYLSQRSLQDYQRSLEGPLRDWHNTPINKITEQDILVKYRRYHRHGQARCNNAMRLLRAIFNYTKLYLITEDHLPLIYTNPADILCHSTLWKPSPETNKHPPIKPEQLEGWWRASQQLRNETSRDYLQFLLLSGLPHAVASSLRVTDVDFDNKLVYLSTKGEQVARPQLPLSSPVYELLMVRARKADKADAYLFPGLRQNSHLTDLRTAIKYIRQAASIPFTLKSLQKTFMQLAEKVHYNQSTLALMSALLRLKPVPLTVESIEQLRVIQEQVGHIIFELVDKAAQKKAT